MKVHLIKKQTIEDYSSKHGNSKRFFTSWLTIIKYADWENPEDILATFSSADLIGNGTNRVIFNIGSNHFRMICKYFFGLKQVRLFVCWIGTHAEYDKICRNNEQYTINDY